MVAATHRAAMWRMVVKEQQRQLRRRGRSERSWDLREVWSAGVTTSRTWRLFTTAWAAATISSDGSGVDSQVYSQFFVLKITS